MTSNAFPDIGPPDAAAVQRVEPLLDETASAAPALAREAGDGASDAAPKARPSAATTGEIVRTSPAGEPHTAAPARTRTLRRASHRAGAAPADRTAAPVSRATAARMAGAEVAPGAAPGPTEPAAVTADTGPDATAAESPALVPREIPASIHGIDRNLVSVPALHVIYRLHEAGYRACLVGGAVRDLLLGEPPKDFDVATDAHPEQVKRLFRNCRLIGRRFRLAHVTYGREIVEVATFRAPHNGHAGGDGDDVECVTRDNCYGTIEQDAARRDFSVNALYYDPVAQSLLDFGTGLEDLAAGELKLIGDPRVRLREDPVRMLRAVRFVSKHGFRLDPALAEAITELADRIVDAAPARLFDEVIKLFHNGHARKAFLELEARGLFAPMFPQTARHFEREGPDGAARRFLLTALDNTDARVRAGQGVNPAFLYAALLWGPVQARATFERELDHGPETAMDLAIDAVLREQIKTVMIPRRFGGMMREIWELQHRLEAQRDERHALRLVGKARFRAGFDFYCLRAKAGQADPAVCAFWTEQAEHAGASDDDGDGWTDRDADRAPHEGDGDGPVRRGRRRRGGRRRGGSRCASAPPAGQAAGDV